LPENKGPRERGPEEEWELLKRIKSPLLAQKRARINGRIWKGGKEGHFQPRAPQLLK